MPRRNTIAENLRPLQAHELVLDHPLPGHVRDAAGHILLHQGQKLTCAKLDALEKWYVGGFYAGPDWPPAPVSQLWDRLPASADELMSALRRRRSTDRDEGNFRAQERHVWKTRLRLKIHENDKAGVRQREVEVETADVSPRGFAFLHDHFVHPGTIIYTQLEALDKQPVVKAIVRACHLVSGRQHRVGCQFVEIMTGGMPR